MSLAILFHFLCAQHVSEINISIIRSLWLFCWITTLIVLFLVRCVLEFRCGWVGLVSVLQAKACNTDTTPNYVVCIVQLVGNKSVYVRQLHRRLNTFKIEFLSLTLNPPTWKIWWAHINVNRWQMGFNSSFEGLKMFSVSSSWLWCSVANIPCSMSRYESYQKLSEWCPRCRLQPASRIPLQTNHTEIPTHLEPRTIRPMW